MARSSNIQTPKHGPATPGAGSQGGPSTLSRRWSRSFRFVAAPLTLCLLALLAVALTALAMAPDGAAARKTKTTASYFIHQVFTHDGSTVTFDYTVTSRNRHCANNQILGWKQATFLFHVDPTLSPGAVKRGVLSHSQTYTPQRVGPGHYRLVFPAGQLVPTTNPDGTNGGSYTMSYWWPGFGLPGGSHHYKSDLVSPLVPSKGKVRYKKRGLTHVVKCEKGESPFDLRNDVNPGLYGAWIPALPIDSGFPIPGVIDLFNGTWS